MARAKRLLTCTAAFVALDLIAAAAVVGPALVGPALALTAEATAGAAVPDDTYGEGGTKQQFSNAARQVLVEVWRDTNGIIREQHETPPGGDEYWGFFFRDGSTTSEWGGSGIEIHPMERPAGRWTMTVYAPGNSILRE